MQNVKLKEYNPSALAIPFIFLLAYIAISIMIRGNGIFLFVIVSLTLIFLAGLSNNNYFFYSMILLMPFTRVQLPYFPLSLYLSLFISFTGFIILLIKKRDFPKTQLNAAIVIYTTIMLISIIRTYIFTDMEPPGLLDPRFGLQASRHRGWYQLVTYISMLSVFFFTVWSSSRTENFRKTIKILLGITIATVIFGFYEFLAKLFQLPLITISTNYESIRYVSEASFNLGGINFPRVYSTFIEPSDFSNFLLIGFSISYSLFLYNRRKGITSRKITFMLISIALGIILTFSTAGWICALIIFFILSYVYGFKQLIPIAIVSCLGIWILAFFMGHDNLTKISYDAYAIHFEKLFDFILGYNETSFRTIGRNIFWNIFKQYPFLGVGLGNEVFYSGYFDDIMGCSNHYLTIIAETGLIGLAAFIYLISRVYSVLRQSLKSIHNNMSTELYPYAYALFAALTGTLVFHLYGYGRFFMHEWFLIGMCFCLYNITQKKSKA
jgi:hypothetical protein